METPNQKLTDMICSALTQAGIANEKEVATLKAHILAGKIKAEDWYLAVEKTLSAAGSGEQDGK